MNQSSSIKIITVNGNPAEGNARHPSPERENAGQRPFIRHHLVRRNGKARDHGAFLIKLYPECSK